MCGSLPTPLKVYQTNSSVLSPVTPTTPPLMFTQPSLFSPPLPHPRYNHTPTNNTANTTPFDGMAALAARQHQYAYNASVYHQNNGSGNTSPSMTPMSSAPSSPSPTSSEISSLSSSPFDEFPSFLDSPTHVYPLLSFFFEMLSSIALDSHRFFTMNRMRNVRHGLHLIRLLVQLNRHHHHRHRRHHQRVKDNLLIGLFPYDPSTW
jgi:hypothetical protein